MDNSYKINEKAEHNMHTCMQSRIINMLKYEEK